MALEAVKCMQQSASETESDNNRSSNTFGSIGRLCSSADEDSSRGTISRRRHRHPPHVETRAESHATSTAAAHWTGGILESYSRQMRGISIMQPKDNGISVVQPPDQWTEIEVTVDSGACVTVMPRKCCEGISILQNALSRAGVEYEVANGAGLKNLGERQCEVMTAGSDVPKRIVFQVADVHKPLLSITACADMGFDCYLGSKGGMLYDTVTHETIPLDRKGTLYTMKMWVRQDQSINIAQPFAGPA